jgi:hypothetical protein
MLIGGALAYPKMAGLQPSRRMLRGSAAHAAMVRDAWASPALFTMREEDFYRRRLFPRGLFLWLFAAFGAARLLLFWVVVFG